MQQLRIPCSSVGFCYYFLRLPTNVSACGVMINPLLVLLPNSYDMDPESEQTEMLL